MSRFCAQRQTLESAREARDARRVAVERGQLHLRRFEDVRALSARRPDLKWLRRAQDLESFATRQATILDALWQVLRANGKLLYATCSVFPQENDGVISAFLERQSGARRVSLADGGAAQWLPDAEHDGFYYALIEKVS